MWRDDIHQWRREYDAAQLALTTALTSHNAALIDHAKAIDKHEKEVVKAEHNIMECERTNHPAMEVRDRDHTKAHADETHDQELLQETHERIKRHHYSTMARLAVLVQALGADM